MKVFRPQRRPTEKELCRSSKLCHGPEGKSGAPDGQRQMGAAKSILLCRGSNALRRVRWKRGKLRPCVAYHEIRLEVEEQRPNGARDGELRSGGVCSAAALGHPRCMYLKGHSFTAGCCGGRGQERR